jgi:uncharacterized protein YndB with AHSA1/START domain
MPGLMIDREVLIEAPAEVVWRTITEPDQVSQSFADRVELVVEPRTRLRVVESGHELLAWPDAEKERYAGEHRGGWAESLDRLASLLAKRQPG